MMKWIFGLVILVAIAGAAAWWFGYLEAFGFPSPMPKAVSEAVPQEQPTAPTVQNDLPTATNDTSTSALEQDFAAVDAQLQALEGDSASVDASLSDEEQLVPQEY